MEAFEATPAKKTELLAEAMSRKFGLFPNQDESGQACSEDDMESAEMIGDISVYC